MTTRISERRAEWIQIEVHRILCERMDRKSGQYPDPLSFFKAVYRRSFFIVDKELRERYEKTCPYATKHPMLEIRNAVLLGEQTNRFKGLGPTKGKPVPFRLLFGPPEIRWVLELRRLLLKTWEIYIPINIANEEQWKTIRYTAAIMNGCRFCFGDRDKNLDRALRRLFRMGERLKLFESFANYVDMGKAYTILPLPDVFSDWWVPFPKWPLTPNGRTLFVIMLPKIFEKWGGLFDER